MNVLKKVVKEDLLMMTEKVPVNSRGHIYGGDRNAKKPSGLQNPSMDEYDKLYSRPSFSTRARNDLLDEENRYNELMKARPSDMSPKLLPTLITVARQVCSNRCC